MFLRKKKEFCILVTFSFLKHFQDLIILAAVPGLQIRRWCPAYLAIKIHKPPTLRKKVTYIYSLLQNMAVIKLIGERFILENQLYNFRFQFVRIARSYRMNRFSSFFIDIACSDKILARY